MLRGTTAALLLGLAEVNAYMISVPWLENVPRAYTIRSLGITEEADVYIRVYAPGQSHCVPADDQCIGMCCMGVCASAGLAV